MQSGDQKAEDDSLDKLAAELEFSKDQIEGKHDRLNFDLLPQLPHDNTFTNSLI